MWWQMTPLPHPSDQVLHFSLQAVVEDIVASVLQKYILHSSYILILPYNMPGLGWNGSNAGIVASHLWFSVKQR